MKDRKAPLSLRLSAELEERAREEAAARSVSLNSFICTALWAELGVIPPVAGPEKAAESAGPKRSKSRRARKAVQPVQRVQAGSRACPHRFASVCDDCRKLPEYSRDEPSAT